MSRVENERRQLRVQVLERVGQRHVLLAVHRVLAEPHQQRRLGGEAARPVGHGGVELVGRNDLVDDPDPLRLARVDLLAQQQQLVGLSCARRCGRSAP